MKRNIVIAAVTAAALIGGGTATALATTDDDDAGTTTRQTDVRGASDDDAGDRADDDADADDADDRDDSRDGDGDDDASRVSSAKVTAADAIAAALKEAPGTVVSAELDDEDDDDGDDGDERAAWEVDVLSGDGTWHSVWIDPVDGTVLGSEKDDDEDDTDEVRAALRGTSVDAAEAAKAAAGHGTVTSVELDDDGYYGDGEVAWEVETRTSGEDEQDWRVDPETGKVTADRSHHSDSDDSDDSGSDDD
ncbi:PepSY domain-containing protein [Streptomyces sp. WG5]|uniref:PepSY domain-containing protein n=1 Tax=Streptomyces sp. WG5 TaxID=3417648 RepID=UPI003CEBF140